MKLIRSSIAELGGLLTELRRRHVFRVALAYGAVSWIVLEVSSATFPPLGIPEWALSFLAMLLILGFPVAMVLAWAYDITPDGVQRARPGAAQRAGSPDGVPVVAALPFADVSPDGGYQFLGDGMADELIGILARHGGVRVVGRTSSFSFRGGTADVQTIAERLNVSHVVEGSVRVAGDRVRIHAQLIDAATGFAVWSDRYDAPVSDLIAAQAEFARAVVNALPTPAARSGSVSAEARRGTLDVQAYTHYLRGRELWNQRSPSALRSAVGQFDLALERDPLFAHALAGRADSYAILMEYGVIDPAAALPAARAAAARALHLGPDVAEAHASAALVQQITGDVAGAEAGFRRAIALGPAHSTSRQRLALLLAWTDRFADARQQVTAARDLDPLSPVMEMSRGWIEYYAGDFTTAAALLEHVAAAYPAFTAARVPLALALLQLGRPADAAAALEVHLRVSERTVAVVALHAHALARAGRTAEAGARLAALRRLARRRYVPQYHLAVACVGLGLYDDALEALGAAVDARAPQLVYLPAEHLFAPLRDRPAFADLVDRVRPSASRLTAAAQSR
jgi:adenylate cyclase